MDDSNLKFLAITGVISTLVVAGIVLLLGSNSTQPSMNNTNVKEILMDNGREYNQLGNKDAKITITEISDFQCPFCRMAYPIVEKYVKDHPNTVKLVFRHFPLSQIHPNAYQAAIAVETAGSYGKFWEMASIMMDRQEEWGKLSPEEFYAKIEAYAKESGIEDIPNYMKDVKDQKVKQIVDKDIEDGEKLQLEGTPSFFVNDQPIRDYSPENLDKIINKILNPPNDQ